jgi:intracellular septation protein
MKFLSDFLPVALFFGSYLITHDMFLATKVLVAATACCLPGPGSSTARWTPCNGSTWPQRGTAAVPATVISHNDLFIIWKFTVLYWLMAIACWSATDGQERPETADG